MSLLLGFSLAFIVVGIVFSGIGLFRLNGFQLIGGWSLFLIGLGMNDISWLVIAISVMSVIALAVSWIMFFNNPPITHDSSG